MSALRPAGVKQDDHFMLSHRTPRAPHVARSLARAARHTQSALARSRAAAAPDSLPSRRAVATPTPVPRRATHHTHPLSSRPARHAPVVPPPFSAPTHSHSAAPPERPQRRPPTAPDADLDDPRRQTLASGAVGLRPSSSRSSPPPAPIPAPSPTPSAGEEVPAACPSQPVLTTAAHKCSPNPEVRCPVDQASRRSCSRAGRGETGARGVSVGARWRGEGKRGV